MTKLSREELARLTTNPLRIRLQSDQNPKNHAVDPEDAVAMSKANEAMNDLRKGMRGRSTDGWEVGLYKKKKPGQFNKQFIDPTGRVYPYLKSALASLKLTKVFETTGPLRIRLKSDSEPKTNAVDPKDAVAM